MSGDSSLLVEKLWRLKRRIDKGACPGVEFVHLNTLLREPAYRADVLRRVEQSGNAELKALAREITLNDDGQPLVVKENANRLDADKRQSVSSKGWFRRNAVFALPVLAMAGVAAGFTAFENRAEHIDSDTRIDTTWKTGKRYIPEATTASKGTTTAATTRPRPDQSRCSITSPWSVAAIPRKSIGPCC